MAKIHVVTDSGNDLSREMQAEFGIHVVPLTVRFSEESFHDGVDISVEQFYHRLQNDPEIPSTSQPSPADFVRVYEEIAEPGDTILSVHLSSKMSGTYQSAVLAGTMVDSSIKVIVIDTGCASIGSGLVPIALAEALQKGASLDELTALAERISENLEVYFVVDTLEYLQKNGRIGMASALVGTLLSIKPVLTVKDGFVAPFEKVRGKSKALKRVRQLALNMKEKFPEKKFRAALSHADNLTEAEQLASFLKEKLPLEGEVLIAPIGPTIGVHTGPGTVAMFIYPVF
ncbi:MAG: DegV family protein [Firmicutes bacterium]|nr:DegV family protein [Bacillota bacterium]